MNQSASAFQIPLNDDPHVEIVSDDIDSCTLVYDDSIVDMIEEERCPLADPDHSDGLHFYRAAENSCARCGMAAPWVRRDQCRAA